jgi:hypothetical protein
MQRSSSYNTMSNHPAEPVKAAVPPLRIGLPVVTHAVVYGSAEDLVQVHRVIDAEFKYHLFPGEMVLLTNHPDPAINGIYVVAMDGTPHRPQPIGPGVSFTWTKGRPGQLPIVLCDHRIAVVRGKRGR